MDVFFILSRAYVLASNVDVVSFFARVVLWKKTFSRWCFRYYLRYHRYCCY